jgi:hypothetical protein
MNIRLHFDESTGGRRNSAFPTIFIKVRKFGFDCRTTNCASSDQFEAYNCARGAKWGVRWPKLA